MSELKTILICTFQKRQSLNQAYSRNAFARDLGVSSTALSQYLSNKRNLSKTNLKRVIKSLYLPQEYLLQSKKLSLESQKITQMKLDTFSLIAEWHHFAILNLIEISSIDSVARIAQRLGLEDKTAEKAIDRLNSLGLIQIESGCYKRTQYRLDTGSDIPSAALRKHNREKMELAIASLEKHTLVERDITSMTLTFDPIDMPKIKNEINKFKKRIDRMCGSDQAKEVYSLNVQFFPLTKKDNQNEK